MILHLSGLHFGENSRFAGRDPKDIGRHLGEAVTAELAAREGGAKASLVVVTGDIARRGGRGSLPEQCGLEPLPYLEPMPPLIEIDMGRE